MGGKIKPRKLLIIAWGWIVFTLMVLIDTVMDFSKTSGNEASLQSLLNSPPPELVNTVGLISFIGNNLYALMTLKLILAAVGIVAAINVLRLKEWARLAMEILAWLMVLIILSIIVFAVKFDIALAADGREWGGLIGAVFMLVFFAVPFFLTAWQLRSRTIIEAIQGDDAEG